MTTNFMGFPGRMLLPLCAALLACSPREQAAATPPAAAVSEPISAALDDSGRVNPDSFPWLVVDSAARTASLELVATRKPGVPSALINGYRIGEARIVVPVGWTVKWNYRSADSTAPHSLVVMVQREKIPLEGGRPSFSNAMTRMVTEGLRPGQSDQSTFEAEEAGWYWMMCGVPSHGLEGEWLELRVDPDAKTARVEVRKKA
jgi:Sulfocyanin (SoxE) domain